MPPGPKDAGAGDDANKRCTLTGPFSLGGENPHLLSGNNFCLIAREHFCIDAARHVKQQPDPAPVKKISSILVANHGEISIRVMRAAPYLAESRRAELCDTFGQGDAVARPCQVR